MMRSVRAAGIAMAAMLGCLAALQVAHDAAAAPPAGKEVAEVLVSGNRIRASQDILAVFGLRPGQSYLEEHIRAGTDRLYAKRSEERRVGKACESGWTPWRQCK